MDECGGIFSRDVYSNMKPVGFGKNNFDERLVQGSKLIMFCELMLERCLCLVKTVSQTIIA